MKLIDLIKKNASSLAYLAILGMLIGSSANAQVAPNIPSITTTPINPNFDFLISWRATNYVPANYPGKVMPTIGSSVEVSFDCLDQGKFVDLSEQNILWYLGDNLLQSGVGLKSVKFTVNQVNPQISISIPKYKDAKYPMGDLEGLTTIPTTQAKAVINAPYPARTIKVGTNPLQAIPYFFNVSDPSQLNISWNVDGSDVSGQSGNPSILNLTTTTQGNPAVGANTGINITIQNPASYYEFARNYVNLDIK
ncbi:MAG: hypothetical protein M1155_00230 [Patescibacteria group bacterium]|nr:hypothetical protein [Patescibacteria group bacterium]